MAACLGLAGCATAELTTAFSSTFVNTRSYRVVPKADGSAVALYTTSRPNRSFHEVGVITIRDWDYPRVVWFARDRAAKAGCDAIIQIESSPVLHEIYPDQEPIYHTTARFTCIVWARAALQGLEGSQGRRD